MLQEIGTSPLYQIINITLNIITLFGIGVITSVVWGYKRRVKERYDTINKSLDHILLLSNELYQSDVKDKKREDLEDQKDQINRRSTGTQGTSGNVPRRVYQVSSPKEIIRKYTQGGN